jgi:hypothetical protein
MLSWNAHESTRQFNNFIPFPGGAKTPVFQAKTVANNSAPHRVIL